ncbi:MAG: hypothetical protein ACRDPA_00815, partial [Solirubrobacteraceae bacterium]
DPVARLNAAETLEQRGEFVDPPPQLLVGDLLRLGVRGSGTQIGAFRRPWASKWRSTQLAHCVQAPPDPQPPRMEGYRC